MDSSNGRRLYSGGRGVSYCCTMVNRCARTAASSLTRCGLFPVASSCAITASTIVSLIGPEPSFFDDAFRGPWAGVSGAGDDSGDDGGGVCSYFILVAGCALAAAGSGSCDRLSLFGCGYSAGEGVSGVDDLLSPTGVDVERPLAAAAAAARAACVTGTWMPRDGSESDFRLVLYGMMNMMWRWISSVCGFNFPKN